MCWKGYSLYSCSAEFRLFWVQSKLAESDATAAHAASITRGGGGAGQQEKQQGTRRFLPLPAYRCTPGGLEMAARQPVRCVPRQRGVASLCTVDALLLEAPRRIAIQPAHAGTPFK